MTDKHYVLTVGELIDDLKLFRSTEKVLFFSEMGGDPSSVLSIYAGTRGVYVDIGLIPKQKSSRRAKAVKSNPSRR